MRENGESFYKRINAFDGVIIIPELLQTSGQKSTLLELECIRMSLNRFYLS